MEKTIIIAVFNPRESDAEIGAVLEEMRLLTESAGGQVQEVFFQKRAVPDSRLYIGQGKAEEVKAAALAGEAELIVFYNRLSNVQQRNLEKFFDIKVIDRTRLILDIFATRARSLEGKLQVELALLLYHLPRLTGKGIQLSRLGGGIGTRGPGETKLEVDRRTIRDRIALIKKRLAHVIKNRAIQRLNRQSYPAPVVSLVGYTSAGKSTLFKALTGEDVPISRQLFSTLDPLLRRVELKDIREGYYFVLSDTVGFIREMPKELFEAFKATLEEVVQSDLIIHVVDISRPDNLDRQQEVEKLLHELQIPDDKIIVAFNKIDLLPVVDPPDGEAPLSFEARGNTVHISARENQGLFQLKQALFDKYFKDYRRFRFSINKQDFNIESIRKWAIILTRDFQADRVSLEILCLQENMVKFKQKHGGLITCAP